MKLEIFIRKNAIEKLKVNADNPQISDSKSNNIILPGVGSFEKGISNLKIQSH